MVLKLYNGHDFVTETDTYNVQRGITQNYISKSYGSCTLQVIQCWLIFLWRFMKISWTVWKLYSGHNFVTGTATYNVQRGITLKVYIQKLWFLRSARCLMLINISMKFHEDILNGFQVTEQTRFCHWNCSLQSSKGHNSKTIYPRVMVLAICTSSNVDWYFYDVPWWYHERFSSNRAIERTALYSVLGIFHERSYANKAIRKSLSRLTLEPCNKRHKLVLKCYGSFETIGCCD